MDRDPRVSARPLFPSGYQVWTTANTIPAGRHLHRSPPLTQRPRGNSTPRRLFNAARTVVRAVRAARTANPPRSSILIRSQDQEPIVRKLTSAPLERLVYFGSSEEESEPESDHEVEYIVRCGEVPVHRPYVVNRDPREGGDADDHFAHLEQQAIADNYFVPHEQEPEILLASSVFITTERPTSIYEPDGPTEVREASAIFYTAAGRPVSVMSHVLTPSQEELYKRAARHFGPRHSLSDDQHYRIPRRPVPIRPGTGDPAVPARSATRGALYAPALNRRSTAPCIPPLSWAPTSSASPTPPTRPTRPSRPISFGRPGGPRREVTLDPNCRTSLDSDIEDMQAIAANTYI